MAEYMTFERDGMLKRIEMLEYSLNECLDVIRGEFDVSVLMEGNPEDHTPDNVPAVFMRAIKLLEQE